ncbi:3-phosphoshikimate 1-carboxyvinyltransferase [Aeromicrobium sp. CF3.5]|uniref:3-phosphoshikimate 1-carboxyvinyltransferase n=1 Tax=Aeromicrobium sp. CF3.5 TaxID=3373078 RepID=UPI003EE5E1BF
MTTPAWAAPYRSAPWDGSVAVPGSKSLTNRALVLAALADEPSTISRPLVSRDTELMAAALAQMGATIDTDDPAAWNVAPVEDRGVADLIDIDCGLAGTVMRFAPAVAALGSVAVRFDGDPRARQRPMDATIAGLRALGAQVHEDDVAGALPFTVHGGSLDGGTVEIDASSSSQFVSALLLVGARLRRGLDLVHVGASLPSQPHIDMTVTELRRRGVQVDVDPATPRWSVRPGPIDGLDVEIEPDLSNAGPFVAAALVTGGRARIEHWPSTTDQAGDHWPMIVEAFGGRAAREGDDLVVEGPEVLLGVELDLHDVGELTPVVAAIAALASGPSTLTGVAHLRGHETDRLAALATEINALGGKVAELEDGLRIEPRPLHGGVFGTYHDHRMAHAAVVLGLRVADLQVENIAATAKTWAGFADVWQHAMATSPLDGPA